MSDDPQLELAMMTQSEYGRHRGCSPNYIGKLIRAGKIPFRVVAGRKLIDPAAADHALGASIERVTVREEIEDDRPTGGSFTPAGDTSGLTKARTATEIYKARIAQLEYDERVFRLIPVEDVTRSMEKCASALVRDIDLLPAAADDLAAAYGRDGVGGLRAELKALALRVRGTIAANMRLLAETETEASS